MIVSLISVVTLAIAVEMNKLWRLLKGLKHVFISSLEFMYPSRSTVRAHPLPVCLPKVRGHSERVGSIAFFVWESLEKMHVNTLARLACS